MITIGHEYELDVVKAVDFGFYLDAEELGQVLLPRRLAPEDLSVGDYVVVFLYLDSEDRPVATTQVPKACVGEFAYLEVVANTNIGAFLDWGLDKDILVPFAEQHRPMEVGKSYLVYLYIDKNDGRIVASSKIDKFLDDEKPHDFTPQQAVNLIIANSTDLGFKAIINHSHWGVLYKDEVHQRLSFGQYINGFIKRVRPDGKIDLSLQGGKETRDKYSRIILNSLKNENGFMPVHDKSDPKLISELFGMSKGAFKKAIGGLYKQRIITIGKDGIHLTGNDEQEPTVKEQAKTSPAASIWNKNKKS
jgi:predicted RNA-binding protein (virulence factor B family)